VTFLTGVRCLFREDLRSGMYVLNVNDVPRNLHYSFVSTVKERKLQFTRREVLAADEARRIQRVVGHPSQCELEGLLDNKAIAGTILIDADACRALHIYIYIYKEQKKLQLRQHALEIPDDTIQNMGIHGSITGKTMTCIICFDRKITCYYSSSEPVTDEEDELKLHSNLYLVQQ